MCCIQGRKYLGILCKRSTRKINHQCLGLDRLDKFSDVVILLVTNACVVIFQILHNLAIKLMTPLFLCRKIAFSTSFLLKSISFFVISDGLNLKLEIAIQDNTYSNCSKIISVVKTTFPACSCISSDKTLTLVLI